jgi:flagellar biosynthesis protein FliQ
MTEAKQQDGKQKGKLNFFELMTEIFDWLQIVISPLLIGLAIGFVIYLSKPDKLGLIIAISVAAVGLIIGIIWAIRVWKKEGTMNFISKIMATPEFDNLGEEKE